VEVTGIKNDRLDVNKPMLTLKEQRLHMQTDEQVGSGRRLKKTSLVSRRENLKPKRNKTKPEWN
jgi:hypothetical protein